MVNTDIITLPTQDIQALLALKGFHTKSNLFRLYIPSINNDGIIPPQKRSQAINYCRSILIELGGGTTEINTLGTYLSKSGGVITEPVILMTSFFSIFNEEIIDAIKDVCLWLKGFLNQEVIVAEINTNFCAI
jgi:hypothetical protein